MQDSLYVCLHESSNKLSPSYSATILTCHRSYGFVNSTAYQTRTPPFPSLYWPPHEPIQALYFFGDAWRFTLIWTFIIYAIFHVSAALIALAMQVGKRRSAWKYLWTIPLMYMAAAGVEALLAGSVVGIMCVFLLLSLPTHKEPPSCRGQFQVVDQGSIQAWRRLFQWRYHHVHVDTVLMGLD